MRFSLAALAALLVAGCGAEPEPKALDEAPAVVRVRPGVTVELDLPAGPGPHPVVVHVPGGGWTLVDEVDVAEAFGHAEAVEDGWAVVTVRYRPAAAGGPSATEQAADVGAALRWVAEEGTERGLSPPVLAMGHSAGAHLLALAVARGDAAPAPDALLLAGGVYDFGVDVRQASLLQDGLRPALGCSATRCPDARPVEPATWLEGDEPPVVLVHGTADRVTPASGSSRFAIELRLADVPVELRRVHGARHRDDEIDAAIAEALADLRAQLLDERSSR